MITFLTLAGLDAPRAVVGSLRGGLSNAGSEVRAGGSAPEPNRRGRAYGIRGWLEALRRRRTLSRTARATADDLAALSPRMLDDLGITPGEVRALAAGRLSPADIEARREERRPRWQRVPRSRPVLAACSAPKPVPGLRDAA